MPELDCFVLAMNDPGTRHAYPPRVRFEIAEGDVSAYRRAADFLNVNAVDVVSLQHEYEIFGAKSGVNDVGMSRSRAGRRSRTTATRSTCTTAAPTRCSRSRTEACGDA